MKKNLLSILILALLIVNIVLTSIMMFSVVGASKKTMKLVTDIASVLKLELRDGDGAVIQQVPMDQTEVYDIPEMTISLQKSDDGTEHWCLLSVALSMNTKDKGYKSYGSAESMQAKKSLITEAIFDVIGSYKMEDLKGGNGEEKAKAEILRRVQSMYDSQFIYKVSFSDIKYQ